MRDLLQRLFLIGTQVQFFVLRIQINKVDPCCRLHVQVNDPSSTTLATPRQPHADFPEPTRPLDHAALFRVLTQEVFERPKLGLGPELLNPFRESRGFDE
jgi:hypothetical protein